MRVVHFLRHLKVLGFERNSGLPDDLDGSLLVELLTAGLGKGRKSILLRFRMLFQQFLFKLRDVVQKPSAPLVHLVGLVLVVVPHYFSSLELFSGFVPDHYLLAGHGQAQVLLLWFLLVHLSLTSKLLQLLEPLLVFVVFFLHLVTDQTHVLTGPHRRKLVRGGGGPGQHIFLHERRPLLGCC